MGAKKQQKVAKQMTKRKMPTLKFGTTTTMSGFTAFSTASFSDLRPARIVRELIQNSLDAAMEADQDQAIVRFRTSQIGWNDVPDIDGYERSFNEAISDQEKAAGGLSDAAEQVVRNIRNALDILKAGNHHSLSILDNGIGLDEMRMTSLLGDGTSVKNSDASGSYGVGHFASIPASDLRYVLYGGIVEGGRRIAAGSAVLASRGR